MAKKKAKKKAKYQRKQFGRLDLHDHEIQDPAGSKIGIIRITPSSVKWKPKDARSYHAVTLEKFAEWITSDESGSKKQKK